MSSKSGTRSGDSRGSAGRRTSVEATALFPRLHVSNAKSMGAGPRPPPRNKMALYEQVTSPSQQASAIAQQAAASLSGSFQGGQLESAGPGSMYRLRYEYSQYAAPQTPNSQTFQSSHGSKERLSVASGMSSEGSAGHQTQPNKESSNPAVVGGSLQAPLLLPLTRRGSMPATSSQSQAAVSSVYSGPSSSAAEQWAWWAWQQRQPWSVQQPSLSGPGPSAGTVSTGLPGQVNGAPVIFGRDGHGSRFECQGSLWEAKVAQEASGSERRDVSGSGEVPSSIGRDSRQHQSSLHRGKKERQERSTSEKRSGRSSQTQLHSYSSKRSSGAGEQGVRGREGGLPGSKGLHTSRGDKPSRRGSGEGEFMSKKSHSRSSSDGDGVLSEQSPPREAAESEADSARKRATVLPMDVVAVIGESEFWKARKAMVRQERVFSQQVFEMHRLFRVQKLASRLASKSGQAPEPCASGPVPLRSQSSAPEQFVSRQRSESSAAGSTRGMDDSRLPTNADYVATKIASIRNAFLPRGAISSESAPTSQISQDASNVAAAAANVVAAEALAKAAQQVEESCAKLMAHRSGNGANRDHPGEARGQDSQAQAVLQDASKISATIQAMRPHMDAGAAAAVAAAGWYPPAGAAYPPAGYPYFPNLAPVAAAAPFVPLPPQMYMQGWVPGTYPGVYPGAGQPGAAAFPLGGLFPGGGSLPAGVYGADQMAMWYAMQRSGAPWGFSQEPCSSGPASQSVSMPAAGPPQSQGELSERPKEDGTVSSKDRQALASQLLARQASPLKQPSQLRRAVSLPQPASSQQEPEASTGLKRKARRGLDREAEPGRLGKRPSGIPPMHRHSPVDSDQAVQLDGGEDDEADSGEERQCPSRPLRAEEGECDGLRSALPLFPTQPEAGRVSAPIKVVPRAVPATPASTANILLSIQRKN